MAEEGRDPQKLAKLLELDMKIRGTYLSHVVPIEDLVREIISYHFCLEEGKRKQFLSLILYSRDYTFSFGIDILEKILGNYLTVIDKFGNVVREFAFLCATSVENPQDAGTAMLCSSSGLIGIDKIVLSGITSKNTNVIVTTRLAIRTPRLAAKFA